MGTARLNARHECVRVIALVTDFAHNGFLGYPTGKKIQLPKDWERLLAARE